MEQDELVARVLKEAAAVRNAIAASYQRLWRSAGPAPADPGDAEAAGHTPGESGSEEEHPSAEADSG
jgi:hypothetical protein